MHYLTILLFVTLLVPSFIIIGMSFFVSKDDRMYILLLLCSYLIILGISMYIFDYLFDRHIRERQDIKVLLYENEPPSMEEEDHKELDPLKKDHSDQEKLLEYEDLIEDDSN